MYREYELFIGDDPEVSWDRNISYSFNGVYMSLINIQKHRQNVFNDNVIENQKALYESMRRKELYINSKKE